MRRGRTTTLLLAVLCLLSGGCATLTGTGSEEVAAPHPPTAIALSVLSDSVYLLDPATGRRAEVAGGLIDFQSGFAVWAPDHRRLAYANHSIYVIDFVRQSERLIARGRSLSMPAWSPFADELLFGNGVSLWRSNLTGGRRTRIRVTATLAPLAMAWGQNGLIAFEGLARECRLPSGCRSTGRSEIWVLDPRGGAPRKATRVGHAENPKWSRDGRRILFMRRYSSSPNRRELWRVNTDGTGLTRLGTFTNVVAADWSPDGSRIALVRAGPDRTLQVWISRADGSNARALGATVPGVEASIDW